MTKSQQSGAPVVTQALENRATWGKLHIPAASLPSSTKWWEYQDLAVLNSSNSTSYNVQTRYYVQNINSTGFATGFVSF